MPGCSAPRPFTTHLRVSGEEVITVAGGEMPVLKLVVKNREGGRDIGEIAKRLHLSTLLTLKSEVREGDKMRAQEAVVLE